MMAARAVNGDLPAALDEIERLRDLLFARGAMRTAPCFACGYNGPGYFQPSTHACATRHHALYQPEPGPGVEAVLELHRSGR